MNTDNYLQQEKICLSLASFQAPLLAFPFLELRTSQGIYSCITALSGKSDTHTACSIQMMTINATHTRAPVSKLY